MDPLSRLLQSKTFFRAKDRPKPFFANTGWLRWSKFFRRRGDELKKKKKKKFFVLTLNFQNLFVFGQY